MNIATGKDLTSDNLIPKQAIGRDIVFFDGTCVMCNRLVKDLFSKDIDKHFLVCAQQSPVGKALLARHGITSDELKSIYVISSCGLADERLLSRGAAVIYVMNRIPQYKNLAGIAAVFPEPLINIGYNFVAAIRYKIFGKQESCSLPSSEDRARMLD